MLAFGPLMLQSMPAARALIVDAENPRTAIADTDVALRFVECGRHSSVRKAIEEAHNIIFLEYDSGAHEQVVEALRHLAATKRHIERCGA
jgi:hypothetical protein